jgi:hypothetical protein
MEERSPPVVKISLDPEIAALKVRKRASNGLQH